MNTCCGCARRLWIPLFALAWLWSLTLILMAAVPSNKPVLLYSRYFNAAGEDRYLPDGTYKEVLERLRNHFDVRVHNERLTRQALTGVRVVLIANPNEAAVGTNRAP